MGWDYTHAFFYKDNGSIDKKAEIESNFDKRYEVLKSVIIGSTYYGAIKDTQTGYVGAEVVLIHINTRDYCNIGLKYIGESCGPCECSCPASILKLLSPTDSEFAIEWRERCRASIEAKKSPHALSNLPIGARIRYKRHNGEQIELIKHAAAYQFKRPFWYNPKNNTYTMLKCIPADYEVVTV